MSSPRQLADRFHTGWLATHPFEASNRGIPGYDDRAPDASEEGDMRRRAALEGVLAEAAGLRTADRGEADEVTVGCLTGLALQEMAELGSAAVEHTVTAMPFFGPAGLLAVAARTLVADAGAAGDYLTRLRRSALWVDQQVQRLRTGEAKGRLPVAPLVAEAVAWAEGVLAAPVPEALAAPQPPAGWDGGPGWREERDAVATDVVKPALSRWVEVLRDILPRSRPAERPGLTYIPGGDADYERAVRSHTTMAVTAEQLHRTGLDEIDRLEKRALELGAQLGLRDLEAVNDALRGSAGVLPAGEAMEAARRAVRRAEARAGEVFPEPLPGPCAVEPMPPVVASSGTAPHYTPPRLDGARPGTYWFNTLVPTAGTGWDLEGVAFHEAVPGHHLQLSRIQMLMDLPAMQRQRSVTVFSEGWGLYAEQLAEEMGLYNRTESLLGATTAALLRAARLVVDTGLHARGWSRQKALEFCVAHVPMPPRFLAAEVDRYIIWPGQALAYLTGKLRDPRARDEARRRLGPAFSLPEFHAALLGSGSLPIPVLHQHIDWWAGTKHT